MSAPSIQILLVEDNPTDVLLLREALRDVESVRLEFSHVERLGDAIERLNSGRFDVIILDLNLPDASGLPALRQIRSAHHAVPIVVLTALDDEEMALRAVQEGAQDYLVKGKTEGRATVRAIRYAIERKRGEELERAKQAAEEASRAKDRFLAVLSHELRTPLTPILAAAQHLETDDALPPHVREAVAMIRRNALLEARLIDDLLDLTRITRGKLNLDLSVIDAHEAIQQAIEMCRDDADGKNLRLETDLSAAEHRIKADRVRFQQVMWNLLKNAIKFTPPQGLIGVRTCSADGHLAVEIRDSGIGIEPDVMPRLFSPFEQGGEKVTRQFGGLGLGLVISKALVEMHGGSLRAESQGIGKGAVFTVELPVTRESETRGESRLGLSGPGHAARCGRVLLVEDHADTARMMTLLLGRMGWDVIHAGSVRSALELAQREPFDLLISDLGLPDGSGVDLMRELSSGAKIRGIAISGYGQEQDRRRSLEAGFMLHLTKPVDLGQLSTAVKQICADLEPS